MKRIIGMIVLLFGFLITNIGVYAMTLYVAKGYIFKNHVNHDENFRSEIGRDVFIGYIFFVVGLILFITGLVLITAKTRKHKNLDLELKQLKLKEYHNR
jgi:NhaP-type Na+/H+ or K+/H+ antiporter